MPVLKKTNTVYRYDLSKASIRNSLYLYKPDSIWEQCTKLSRISLSIIVQDCADVKFLEAAALDVPALSGEFFEKTLDNSE